MTERHVHYTFDQLKSHSERPVAEIDAHLRNCASCYETGLLIKLTAYQNAQPNQQQPSAAFLEKLATRLDQKPASRLIVMKKPTAWIPALAAACALLALILFHRLPESDMQLAYSHGNVFVNNRRLAPQDKIHIGDRIRTGEDSLAIIDLGGNADITLMPATEVALSAVHKSDVPEIEIRQFSGYTYNRIAKGKARYKLTTENFDAVVRGTQFAVDLNHEDGRVKLHEGLVHLQHEILRTNLLPGYKVHVAGKKPRLMEKLEKHEIDFARNFTQISFPLRPGKDHVIPQKEIVQSILDGEHESWTLNSIRKRYGKLSAVYTRSGRVLIGGFYSNSQGVVIQTEKEKIRLSLADVGKIIPYER